MNTARVSAILALAFCTYEGRRLAGAFFNPVTWYCLPFFLILAYQELMLPSLAFGTRASLLLIASAVALLLGFAIGGASTPRSSATSCVMVPRMGRIGLTAAALFFLLGAALNLYLVQRLVAAGVGFENGTFYRQRFFTDAGPSTTLRILQAVTYAGAFYLAVVFRALPRGRLFIAAFLGLTFVQGAVISTKASMLIATLIFVVTAVTVGGMVQKRSRVRAVGAVALLVAAIVLTFGVVTQQRSQGTADIAATIEYSLAGGPSALSMVLNREADINLDAPFGLTFGGLQETLGLSNRTLGIYADVVVLRPGVPESQTNIYTWFVPLMHDFGLVGTLGVVFGIGLLTGALTRRLRAGALGVPGRGVLALINCVLAYASITALTYYNFMLLLFFLTPVLGRCVTLDASRSNVLAASVPDDAAAGVSAWR